MRRELACLTVALILLCSMTTSVFAVTPLFNGMFVAWTGTGEWDYNGLKSTIKVSGRIQSTKTATGYILSFSKSVSGIPRTFPLLTQTMTFNTLGDNRTLVYDNSQYYSPFWIEIGRNVGDKVQVGPLSSPYLFNIQSYETREILGKTIRCLVASYSIKLSNFASVTTINGQAVFDSYSRIIIAGTMDYLFSSLQSPYYEKITAQATLSETNVEIGGPAFPWWIIPAAAGVAVVIAVVVVLFWQRRRRGRSQRMAKPRISPTIPAPTLPPSPIEAMPTMSSVSAEPPMSTPPIPAVLDEPSAILSEPVPSPSSESNTCRVCGALFHEGWTFCGECGAPMSK